MSLTVAQFKVLKPQFNAVDDAGVDGYLTLALRWIGTGWLDADKDLAQAAVTCHLMTLEGLGTDAESVSFASGADRYTSIRSGELTLTRKTAAPDAAGDAISWFGQTKCGQFYTILLRLNRRGPIGVSVATMGGHACYVKDGPL